MGFIYCHNIIDGGKMACYIPGNNDRGGQMQDARTYVMLQDVLDKLSAIDGKVDGLAEEVRVMKGWLHSVDGRFARMEGRLAQMETEVAEVRNALAIPSS